MPSVANMSTPGGDDEAVTRVLKDGQRLSDLGGAALRNDSFDEAANCVNKGLEDREQHDGDLPPECTDTYYKYDCALFDKPQAAADPFCEIDGRSNAGSPFHPAPSRGFKTEDEILKRTDTLTVEEVVSRRARRVRQLMKLYRAQYWGLLEEMRSKYRRFYLRHGKSGWRHDVDGGNSQRADAGEATVGGIEGKIPDTPGGMKEPHAPEKAGSETLRCGAQGCQSKPLLLSVFCYQHVVHEPRQRLYRPCSFVTRSAQPGNTLCSKPVLRAVAPPLCVTHFQQTQKQATRSLRKAGLVLPPNSTLKSTPKLHYFIAEYVRVIQAKRYALQASVLRSALPKGGEEEGKSLGGPAMVVGWEQRNLTRRVVDDTQSC